MNNTTQRIRFDETRNAYAVDRTHRFGMSLAVGIVLGLVVTFAVVFINPISSYGFLVALAAALIGMCDDVHAIFS